MKVVKKEMIIINKVERKKIRDQLKENKLRFTINELNKLKIRYSLKNIKTGQINIKIKNNLIVYYSNTDKILLNNHSIENKGIVALINLINKM